MNAALEASVPAPLAEEDGEVRRLIRALALSDRFLFCVVVCPSPAAVGSLSERLERATDPPRKVVRLAPPDVSRNVRALREEELRAAVLDRLLAPPDGSAGPDIVTIIDAAATPNVDAHAWRSTFQRMNEQRNRIVSRHAGALLLCVSRTLEQIFIEAAPDFWSIRSGDYLLPPPPSGPMHLRADAWREAAYNPETDGIDLDTILRRLAEARENASLHPQDGRAAVMVWLWLSRMAHAELQRGLFDRARDHAEEAATLARRLDEDAPLGDAALGDSLVLLGRAARECGDLEASLKAHREAVDAERRRTETTPHDVTAWHSLWCALKHASDAANRADLDDLRDALDAEALAAARRLVELDSEAIEYRYLLTSTKLRIATFAEGPDADPARVRAYEECVAEFRSLYERSSRSVLMAHDLAGALSFLADVIGHAGRVYDALDLLDESLQLRRDVSEAAPNRLDWHLALLDELTQTAKFHEQAGDLAGADRLTAEGELLARKLAERHAASHEVLDHVARTLLHRARVAERCGFAGEAVGVLTRLDDVLERGFTQGLDRRPWDDAVHFIREQAKRLSRAQVPPPSSVPLGDRNPAVGLHRGAPRAGRRAGARLRAR